MATTDKPGYVAVIITDEGGSQVLVKDVPNSDHFLLPLYDVAPEIYFGDLQFNARLNFEFETGISNEEGYWHPVGNVEVAKGKLIHLYIATFLRDITPPAGWHWCDLRTFQRQTLVSRSTDPKVQEAQALATVALLPLTMLQVFGFIP